MIEKNTHLLSDVVILQQELAAHKARIVELEAQLADWQSGQAFLESGTTFRNLIECIPYILWMANTVGEVIYCNTYGLNVFGRSLAQIVGMSWLDVIHPEDKPGVQTVWQEALATGQAYSHRFRIFHQPSQNYHWYQVDGLPLKNEADEIVNWYGISIDIEEQVQNQTEHLNHERFLRSVVDSQTNYVIRTDLEGRYTFINEAFKTQFNLDEAILGRLYFDTVHEADRELCQQAAIACVQRPGHVATIEIRKPVYAPRSGGKEILWYLWSRWEFVAIADEMGNLHEIQAVGRDITPQKKVESDLALMTDRLKLAAEAAQLGVWDLDVKNDVLIWNQRMRHIYGFPEQPRPLKYAEWQKALHPEDAAAISAALDHALKTDGKFETQFRIITPSGQEKHILGFASVFFDQSKTPVRMIGINQDVTAQYYLEQQLRQTQKMEALGQLAGGVAHNFNNILTALIGHASLAIDALPHQHPAHQDLKSIYRIAERASKITKQLLTFTRQQSTNPQIINLNTIINDVQTMLPHLVRSNISLLFQLDPHLPTVKADPYQMEQVIINLVINAKDAIAASGQITLSTEHLTLTETQALNKNVSPGPFVKLNVSDTGSGIAPELQRHIFEPFFTTKDPGQGTGLGLSTCLGIVQQHQGHISVESTPSQGTTFSVYLPAQPSPPQSIAARPEPLPSGTELIMVVEDESSLRYLIGRILKMQGYNVQLLPDVTDAIADLNTKQAENQPLPHLILCDVIMPTGTAYQLLEYLKEQHLTLPFMLMSGYQENENMQTYLQQDHVYFLSKPFTPPTLVHRIQQALELGVRKV